MRLASLASSVLLVASAAVLAIGCSSSGEPTPLDSKTCPLGQSHYYPTPGCGTAAPAPVCMDDEPFETSCPATMKTVCGCNNVTYTTSCLGANKAPWSAEGACPGDGGTDATSETGSETGSDAASDASDAASSG